MELIFQCPSSISSVAKHDTLLCVTRHTPAGNSELQCPYDSDNPECSGIGNLVAELGSGFVKEQGGNQGKFLKAISEIVLAKSLARV